MEELAAANKIPVGRYPLTSFLSHPRQVSQPCGRAGGAAREGGDGVGAVLDEGGLRRHGLTSAHDALLPETPGRLRPQDSRLFGGERVHSSGAALVVRVPCRVRCPSLVR